MELLDKYGYSLVFIVALLEQLGLPLPVVPVLLLAGAVAATGKLSLTLLIVFSVLAMLIGDIVWYYLGRKKGRGVLKVLCHMSLSPETCVKRTEDSFLKYGMNSLFFAKFIPALNTIAPPMAGLIGSRFISFLWRDWIGALLYTLAFLIPGHFLEKRIFQVTEIFEQLGSTFSWLLIGGLVAYVLMKYIKLKLLQKILYKERITPEELRERLDAGEAVIIVDIRSNLPLEANAGLIPGAIRIPPGEIDQHLHRLEKDKWIVMYCT
jgi:membrane protein DedA with SNARE-associated domain